MSSNINVAVRKIVPTVAQALQTLTAMERQLTAAKTYDEIRRVIKEANALKILMNDVAEVKAAAEDAILIGNKRIAEELRKVPKAKGGGQLGKGGNHPQVKSSGRAETGVPRMTRSRLGKLADIPKDELKATAVKLRAQGKEATVTAVVREITQGDKKERRGERERELAGKIVALPNKRYGVIVADPEWKDTVWSERTGMDRHASNHYPTSDAAVIAARPVGLIAAKDCVLFLWTTNQHLRIAMGVLEAWGFEYKSNYCWGKDKIGTGRWNRSKHELLLIGTRGKVPCPAEGTQWDSLIMAPRGRHSEKPECFLEMIEEYYPNIPKIELNRRGKPRFGWGAWGLEAEEAAE